MPIDAERESLRPAFHVQGREGRYAIPSQVPRRGGQAEVFYAQAPGGLWRAVKIAAGGWDARKAIEREAVLLRDVARREPRSKEWLIELVDEGMDEHRNPFLVLPWYDMSLGDWLAQHGPSAPFSERLRLAAGAARAVARMHLAREDVTRVLVHRDLKPGNFLLSLDDRGLPRSVVLSDLGAAKEGDLAVKASQTRIMTVDYAPPEQMFPIPRASDLRVDVHALGVTAYRVLTGRVPQAIKRRGRFITDAGEALLLGAEEAGSANWESFVRRHGDVPVSQLVNLSGMVALTEEDEQLLRAAVLAAVSPVEGSSDEPATLAELVVSALRKAVQPDPEQRAHEAGYLVAVLEQAWRAAVVVDAPAAAARAAPAGWSGDLWMESPSSSRTVYGGARPMAVGGVAETPSADLPWEVEGRAPESVRAGPSAPTLAPVRRLPEPVEEDRPTIVEPPAPALAATPPRAPTSGPASRPAPVPQAPVAAPATPTTPAAAPASKAARPWAAGLARPRMRTTGLSPERAAGVGVAVGVVVALGIWWLAPAPPRDGGAAPEAPRRVASGTGPSAPEGSPSASPELTVTFKHVQDATPRVMLDGSAIRGSAALSLGEHSVSIQPVGGQAVIIDLVVTRAGEGLQLVALDQRAVCEPGESPVVVVTAAERVTLEGC